MFSIIYCPFLLGCRWSWLTWALGFMFLWLVKSTLWFLHCTFKHSVRSLAFLENLYPRGIILEAAICWPFSFTDKANEINSLVISSDEQTDLRSLVPVSRITRSGFVYVRADIMFHGFSGNSQKWLQKNSVIIVSFVCNRFYRWISKNTCFKSYLKLWVEDLCGESTPCHAWWLFWSSTSANFIYHVTSWRKVIKWSRNFISGSSSWYVTKIQSLVAIGIVVVDI